MPTIDRHSAKPVDSPGIPLDYYENFGKAVAKNWIIKGVISKGETSSWIGPPGSGKSALLDRYCDPRRRRPRLARLSLKGTCRRCLLRAGARPVGKAPVDGARDRSEGPPNLPIAVASGDHQPAELRVASRRSSIPSARQRLITAVRSA